MLLFQLVTNTREEYQVILLLFQKIKYEEHQWGICVGLKMVHFLLGQQNSDPKYSCFLCLGTVELNLVTRLELVCTCY
jgi:hypothetical protein